MYSPPIQRLIDQLAKLPGIGPKTAQRLTFHLLRLSPEEALPLAQALIEAKERIGFCRRCFNLTEEELCEFCRDPRRDPSLICVVEEPADIFSVERTHEYRGLYHVLGGALSPIDGVGPERLRLQELFARVRGTAPTEAGYEAAEGPPADSGAPTAEGPPAAEDAAGDDAADDGGLDTAIREVVVATNPTMSGEATALYIAEELRPEITAGRVRVTRLAAGLPVGGDLEYADEVTLSRAFAGRREI